MLGSLSFHVVRLNEKFLMISTILSELRLFFIFQLRQWELELYHRKDETQESKKLPASVDIWSRNHKATYKISVRVLYWEQEKRKSLQEPMWISVVSKVDSPLVLNILISYKYFGHAEEKRLCISFIFNEFFELA